MGGKKVKLRPNSLKSLIWGMRNFDGIECDLRLNKDNEIVLHHDTKHGQKSIRKMTNEQCKENGIIQFRDFLNNKETRDFYRSGKLLIVEPKPDCHWYRDVSTPDFFREVFFNTIDESDIQIQDNLHMMAFSEKLITPFKEEINIYPIFPLANFCVYKNRWSLSLIKPIVYYFKYGAKKLLNYCHQKEYRGALFSLPYFYLINVLYREKREDIIQLAKDLELNIIANFYLRRLEKKYDHLILLTDNTSTYPQYSENGGAIIGHRGCGANGVKIPSEEYNEL